MEHYLNKYITLQLKITVKRLHVLLSFLLCIAVYSLYAYIHKDYTKGDFFTYVQHNEYKTSKYLLFMSEKDEFEDSDIFSFTHPDMNELADYFLIDFINADLHNPKRSKLDFNFLNLNPKVFVQLDSCRASYDLSTKNQYFCKFIVSNNDNPSIYKVMFSSQTKYEETMLRSVSPIALAYYKNTMQFIMNDGMTLVERNEAKAFLSESYSALFKVIEESNKTNNSWKNKL